MDKEISKTICVIFVIGGIIALFAGKIIEGISIIFVGILALLLTPKQHSKYFNSITKDKELNKWIDKLSLLINRLEEPYITGQYSSCMPDFLYQLLEKLKKDNYCKIQITDLSLYNLIIECGCSIIDSEKSSDYKDLICLIVIDCLKWQTCEGYIKSSDFNDAKTKILEKMQKQ